MASEIRRTPVAVNMEEGSALERFLSAPWRFDVWQACSVLEAAPAEDFPGGGPHGARMDWGVPASCDFPAAPVRGVVFREGEPPRLDVNLPGFAGLDGPLTPWIAELVRERSREGDPAFQDFLDLFHNRLLRLWRDMASGLCPELQPDGPAKGHPFSAFLGAVSGLPGTGERERELAMPGPVPGRGSVSAALFRSCAAVWGMGPRSAAGLEKLVKAAFGVKARVEPFRGAWADLPEEDRTRLGGKAAGNARLGETALLGHRVFDGTAGVTLRLGPLTEQQRRSFLPPPAGTRRADLLALTRWYLGGGVECEVALE